MAIRAAIASPSMFGAAHTDRKRKRQEEDNLEHVQIVNTVHNLNIDDMHDLFPIFPIRNRKIQKHSHPTTEVLGAIKRNKKDIPIRALIDTGTDESIVLHDICDKSKSIVNTKSNSYLTMGGLYKTGGRTQFVFSLPEFAQKKVIAWPCNVDFLHKRKDFPYDMIIGRDLQAELKIIIDWENLVLKWDGAVVPMKDKGTITSQAEAGLCLALVLEPKSVNEAAEREEKMLASKYEKANLPELVHNQCAHLTQYQQASLLRLLKEYEHLFDGTLGDWNTEPVHIQLKEGARPIHCRPFSVPHSYGQQLYDELDRLCQIGVMRKINHSEWAFPTFATPKKNKRIRVVSDFRKLNPLLERHPFPIPKIIDLVQSLHGFTWSTALDLNMGYYTIRLDPDSSKICTIILPWAKYEYLRLPMGISIAPDIFQEKMSTLMATLEFVRVYLDDVLCITKDTFDDHLQKLRLVLSRLSDAGLRINASKSHFCTGEIEYLGFWVTRNGISPMPEKVKAIVNIARPKNRKELRRFIGLVNYYRDMWVRRSHVLAPLTDLTSTKAKFKWTDVHQQAFEQIKKIISREVLLTYPNFSEPFHIHTDASDFQLGGVIAQQGKPIAFYSRKLNRAQRKYTIMERELLSIVETLREYKNILLGYDVHVWTDHQNLTFQDLKSDRVLRWRLLLEEFGVTFHYVKGKHNIVADALSRLAIDDDDDVAGAISRLETSNDDNDDGDFVMLPDADSMAECFGLDEIEEDTFPLDMKLLAKAQLNDKTLRAKVRKHLDDFTERKVEETPVLLYQGRIYVPPSLRKRIINWYHEFLCHPGETRTEQSIRTCYIWPNIATDVKNIVKYCRECQLNKKQRRKYGHLPAKQAETTPGKFVQVDLIGPYKILTKKGERSVQAMTMIDPATSWFEIHHHLDECQGGTEPYHRSSYERARDGIVHAERLEATSDGVGLNHSLAWR